MIKYIALDTETGGLDPYQNPLLQIGCYVPNGQRFNVRIVPPIDLIVTPESMKINGWPDSHKGHETLTEKEAITRLKELFKVHKPDWVVCHNAVFDIPFIRQAMKRTGVDFYLPRALCTMSFAVALDHIGGYQQSKFSLNDLQCEFEPTYIRPQIHDASEDAKLTHIVFQRMLERFDEFAKLANIATTNIVSTNLGNTPNKFQTKSYTFQSNRWGRSSR